MIFWLVETRNIQEGTHKNCALASFLDTRTVEVGPYVHWQSYAGMVQGVLFQIAPNWKLTKCSSTGERAHEWSCVHTWSSIQHWEWAIYNCTHSVSECHKLLLSKESRHKGAYTLWFHWYQVQNRANGIYSVGGRGGWKGAQGIILFLIWVLFSWAY